MKKTFPQKGKWIQSNRGDIFGSLWATFNIDLDSNRGKLRISPRTRVSTDDFGADPPSAFVRSNADNTDRWWALWGNTLVKTSDDDSSGSFSEDGSGHSGNSNYDESDMVSFNGDLIVSTPMDLDKLSSASWDTGWWQGTLSQSGLTDNVPHPLHVSRSSRRLLIGDDNKVHAIDISDNVVTDVVVLPSRYRVIWIRSGSDRNWIGVWDTEGGYAGVVEYSELQENYDQFYRIDSNISMAGVVKNGVLYTISRSGALLAFTGGGFEPVAHFPIYESVDEWKEPSENSVYGHRMVHPNGMDIIDGQIHILIRNTTVTTLGAEDLETYEQFPAGIWAFGESGLYHKYSLSQYDGTENDYGVGLMYDEVGALKATRKEDGKFLVAAEFNAGGGEGNYTAIFYLNDQDNINKRGFFILPKVYSSEIQNTWQSIWAIFKQLENSTDRIIFKYRKENDISLPVFIDDASWSDTDTITTTDSGVANISANDELWIMQGLGAGTLVHVSSISKSGGTYTIELAETVTGASSGSCRILVTNWTKLTPISTQSITSKHRDISKDSEWIQIKVELRGKGRSPELDKLILTHFPCTFAEN